MIRFESLSSFFPLIPYIVFFTATFTLYFFLVLFISFGFFIWGFDSDIDTDVILGLTSMLALVLISIYFICSYLYIFA